MLRDYGFTPNHPFSKHQALDTSLAKAESKAKHWKQEAKCGVEKIEWVEKERDEAK